MHSQLPTWLLAIQSEHDLKKLDVLKAELLGKTGTVSSALKQLGQLSPEERKTKGAEINTIRDALQAAFASQHIHIQEILVQQKINSEKVDVTLPHFPQPMGYIHPLTKLMNELKGFFERRGFTCVDGPEIEDEWHNFDALNIPAHHPARQSHDTFYIKNTNENSLIKKLLRTHTSTVQIRHMSHQKPPMRLISMGRVFRSDDLDATHTPMFHQIEGLVIEEGIHMGHLKGLLREFSSALLNVDNAPIRMRPSFFPFTEPSAEVDIACSRKDGKLTMGSGGEWMELLGCGMVHPNVLTNCGIDPNKYQGFAFGMGIERLCMIKNGIVDIRQLYDGDEHWLNHFGSLAL